MLLLALVLLLIPIFFQLMVGSWSINNKINVSFRLVCTTSVLLQIALTFIAFFLAIDAIVDFGNHCATAAVGIIPISFLISIVLIIVMAVQANSKKENERRNHHRQS